MSIEFLNMKVNKIIEWIAREKLVKEKSLNKEIKSEFSLTPDDGNLFLIMTIILYKNIFWKSFDWNGWREIRNQIKQ